MPTANIIIYMNEKDYMKYLKQKRTLNDKTRKYFKEQLK